MPIINIKHKWKREESNPSLPPFNINDNIISHSKHGKERIKKKIKILSKRSIFLHFFQYFQSKKHKKNSNKNVLKNEQNLSIDTHTKAVNKLDTMIGTPHQTTEKKFSETDNHIPMQLPPITTPMDPEFDPIQNNDTTLQTTEPKTHSIISNNNLDDDLNNTDQIFNKDNSSVVFLEKEKLKTSNKKQRKWLKTGIIGFDDLLEEGIPTRSNIIVAGGPGCGKTIFCLQTLYNLASNGDDCVFLSMEERPDRLKEHMLEFGFNIEEIKRNEEQIILRANGKGKISLKRIQPIRIARSIEALLEKASGTLPVDIDLVLDFIPEDFHTTLLTLDSISAIETAFSGTKRQYRIYIEQLFRYFEELELTTFMITESSEAPKQFSTTGVEEFLADGIIVFYNFQGVKQRTRGAEIFKLRGASHSQRIVPIEITKKGIVISSDKSPRDTLIG